jgi:hypothetical protein
VTTYATINGLALDEGSFVWPLYRGTKAQRITLYGFGPKWLEYKAMVESLGGRPAKIELRGSATPGGRRGSTRITIEGVYVYRAIRVGETRVELWCYDSRARLKESVGDMDFNMEFGDGILDGTAFTTYRDAIEAYCRRLPLEDTPLADDAFDRIPERDLERNAHLSALQADDPLGYLCQRANVDLVVGLDGKWYFASRQDATLDWFVKFENENWKTAPGFLNSEHLVLQRPRTIASYYWEHHTMRLTGADPGSTISHSGPDITHVELRQRYLYDGEYLTLNELCTALGFAGTFMTDERIARSFFSPSAQGSPLHPLNTFNRKRLWNVIRRDWRKLWKFYYPNGGSIGAWDMWRFGQLNADGSITPVSVECPWVEFRRVINPGPDGKLEGTPWTVNHTEKSPFKATWDDGPESGVIRLYVDPDRDGERDVLPPLPGSLRVSRKGNLNTALKIIARDELENGEGLSNTVRNLTLFGREDLSKAFLSSSFEMVVYMTARRFMPNDKTRWYGINNAGFANGDVERRELPPSAEINCYRTYVGGGNAALGDGLGAILNDDELTKDAERRVEVNKIVTAMIGATSGVCDTFNIPQNHPRVVDGPVQSVELHLEGVETFTVMNVGDLSDDKARNLIASQRMANRGVKVQGKG